MWSFTSLVHFWPPQIFILATPMIPTYVHVEQIYKVTKGDR